MIILKKCISIVIFIYLCFFCCVNCLPKLPSYFKICHRSDPALEKCIKNSVNELKPLLIKGIPELGIPSCEPLLVPQVVIDQGSGAIALKSTYRDIEIYGPSNFVIRQMKWDFEKDKMKLKIFLPHLEVRCNYTMEGKIFMMPILGKGFSNANYSEIEATVIMKAEKVHKNSTTFYNVKDFYVDFNIGYASILLENLFNGDKDLGDAMNLFVNDNWKQIADEIKPVLEDSVAILCKKFANKIFHKFPIDMIFPK